MVLGAMLPLLLLAAACGDDDDSDQTGGVRAAGEDEGSGAAEGSGGDGPIKIGVILPETGAYAPNGELNRQGIEYYFDSIGNEIEGREIELIFEDEGTATPEVAAAAATKLIQRDDVDVITGIIASPDAFAVREVATAAGVPLVLSNPGTNALTGPDFPTVFRVGYTAFQVSNPMGEWLASEEGVKTINVISTDHTGGKEFAANFIQGFTGAGGTVVTEQYAPTGTQDYSSYLERISSSGADATWAFFGGIDSVRFVQQYDQLGLKESLPLHGVGSLVDATTLEQQGESALGVLNAFFYTASLDNPANEAFVEGMQEAYGYVPNDYNVMAYDAAYLIGEALKATGGDASPEALVAAMREVEFDSPRGPMSLDEHGSVIQNIYVRNPAVVDGAFVQEIVHQFDEVPGQP